MFAIIETGGKQYKVEKGSIVDIELLDQKEGSLINFDKVFLVSDGKDITVGTPSVKGAQVSAKIVAHKRGEKIIVFKMKAKKRYQKKQGHRQEITTIEITDIKLNSGTPTTTAPESSIPKKATSTQKAPAITKKAPVMKKAPATKKASPAATRKAPLKKQDPA